MAVGKGTDSDEDSYKRKRKKKPKRRIINHQIVYESSWVNKQKRKVSQFGGEKGISANGANGAKGSHW
jgi:hypothetical protein